MFDKITQKLKDKPLYGFLFIPPAVLVLLFASLFAFCILQSDDYSYASYLADGLCGFIRLTKEHFLSVNGRALVHFFLHITLGLPKFFAVLIKSAILLFTALLSFKASRLPKCNIFFCLTAFYSLLLLSGTAPFTEAVMWTSGFFNYVFPALFLFLALYFHSKGSALQYLFCFLAGATTEQWGIGAFAVITATIASSTPRLRQVKPASFMPSVAVLAGYLTIFASPATMRRISVSGHASLSESLLDVARLSEGFLKKDSAVGIFVIFIALMLLFAYIKKGAFNALYTGILPLFLIFTLPLHGSYMASFIIFICYLIVCAALFFIKKYSAVSACLFGAAASVIIMLPTNTFDARITFPGTFLIIIAVTMLVPGLGFSKKVLAFSTAALFLVSLIAFFPSYMGYLGNYKVDRANLNAIEEAKETKTLNYSIDYDKRYAVRQMFNDGWFYNSFVALYNLEDCSIYPDSKNAKTIYLDGKALTAKALYFSDEAYLPLRALVLEADGSISTENGTLFTLNGRTLTYLDGMLTYKNDRGNERYLVADKNSIPDFYTLYIKEEIIRDAFGVSISIK